MILRPFLHAPTSCASYLFGCPTHGRLAVLDPHIDLVDDYVAEADRIGSPIVAVFETHIQADHVSGMAALADEAGATAHLPEGSGAAMEHRALDDGARVVLGNTVVTALATPGHARAHHAYIVADRRRGTDDPWLAFTGDALLVGAVGRPDLHAAGDPRGMALALHSSLRRLTALDDGVLVLPSHYGGSVCGAGPSGNPFSTIGFERRHNRMLAHSDPEAFADAVLNDLPPPPTRQVEIVAANLRGALPTAA